MRQNTREIIYTPTPSPSNKLFKRKMFEIIFVQFWHTRRRTCNIVVVFIFMYISIIINFSILLSNYDRFRVKVYMAFSAVNNKMLSKLFSRDIHFIMFFSYFSTTTYLRPSISPSNLLWLIMHYCVI